MITNDIIFFDFETTGVDTRTCQPVQLAAVVIDGRKGEIIEGSEFQSLIKPEFDLQICQDQNLAPLTEDSINIHGKTEAMLREAPGIRTVWNMFTEYVNRCNVKRRKWDAPIAAGFNIIRYDLPIVERIACGLPYKLGPVDKDGRCTLFHPRDVYDVMHDFQRWTHFNPEVNSISMDAMRKYTGASTAGAHDALVDVKQGAAFLCRFLNLYRNYTPRLKLKDSFKGV